jgi:hypothetical protein
MAQVVECLPSKHKSVSLNPVQEKKKRKEKVFPVFFCLVLPFMGPRTWLCNRSKVNAKFVNIFLFLCHPLNKIKYGGLGVWPRCYSALLAHRRPWVHSPVLKNKIIWGSYHAHDSQQNSHAISIHVFPNKVWS